MIRSLVKITSKRQDQQGQVLVIGLFVVLGLAMMAIGVANIGMAIAEKIQLQDAVDAAAYSAAVTEARYMNLSAYINRAMVANYNSMAFSQSLWATADSYDHGLAATAGSLYAIATIAMFLPLAQPVSVALDNAADGVSAVHDVIHDINKFLENNFMQDKGHSDWNSYPEMYNTMVLSTYQGLLYSAMQSARYDIINKVAKKVDKDVITTTVLGLGAEEVSAKELSDAVDFVINDPDKSAENFRMLNSSFDRFFGNDPASAGNNNVHLASVAEASLDKFSAGRDRQGNENLLRAINTGNLMPFSDTVEWLMTRACELSASWLWGDDCRRRFRLRLGSSMLDTDEDSPGEGHVPFVANKRLRETNFFGLNFDIDLGGLEWFMPEFIKGFLFSDVGYSSGYKDTDIHNVANYITPSEVEKFFKCWGSSCLHNQLNYTIAALVFGLIYPPDVHWDGNTDVKPLQALSIQPPRQDLIFQYRAAVADHLSKGTPAYGYNVDLNNVGIPHYYRNDTMGELRVDNSRMEGPSLAVVGVKKKAGVRNLRGLGIDNQYDMTAIARGQVYYLHNPNRPKEIPSLFNPYWAARLAPVDSTNVPMLLRVGIPYISSNGFPFDNGVWQVKSRFSIAH